MYVKNVEWIKHHVLVVLRRKKWLVHVAVATVQSVAKKKVTHV